MNLLIKVIFSFCIIFAWTIKSEDTVNDEPKVKAKTFKNNWQIPKKAIRITLITLITIAPTAVFTHLAPVLTASMNPLRTTVYAAGWGLCAGMAGGLVGSALNKRYKG
jgi:hypothetical protein